MNERPEIKDEHRPALIYDMEKKEPISIEYNYGLQSVQRVLYKWYHLVFLGIILGKEYSPHFADKKLEAMGILSLSVEVLLWVSSRNKIHFHVLHDS